MKTLNLRKTMSFDNTPRLFQIIVVLTGVLFFAVPCTAGVVMNTNDTGADSLPQVIADAAAGETITFDSGIANSTIIFASQIDIGKNLTIDGETNNITVSGGGSVRIFFISGSSAVTLANLTISNGKATGAGEGGGICIGNDATLTADNCTFSNNQATYGGAVDAYGTLNANPN
ncbi:hypothetical protein [Desulfonema magnum]|uniref:Pectin lyase fold-containing n=1 Tax=Desulfonema magnum TaxID=45655 RepID=A0A975GKR7_9BACT|nr:hypothetical protein [Desulfonema magnum]QTA84810.1 pectin lyase fold-containing [Desulfonema magnum]